MNSPAYAEYKPSGVDWIGDIPTDWTVRPLRYVCDVTTGDRDTVERVEDGGYPFFIRSEQVQRINSWSLDCEAVLTPGDGAVGQVFHHYIGRFDFHQRVYAFYNFRGILGRYFFYYLSSLFAKVALDGSAKTTVDSLRMPLIKGFTITHPSPEDQHDIVAYLYRETVKIDALIAKQEQLIATLREDRAATITQAVTKGLDPNVETKDSGVEFVGQIPEHWDLYSLKRLVARVDQGVSPQAYAELADDGWGVLKSGCVNGGVFRDTEHKKLPFDFVIDGGIAVRPGDLLVCRASGSPNLVGSAAIVRTLRYQLILSDKTFRIVVNQHCDASYLEWAMNARPYREQVHGAISGAEGLASNLPLSALRSFLFVVPPLTEQEEIVAYLNNRCAKVDALIAKSTEMIDMLRGYRAALITDAVTGKIDVRGVA